MILPTGAVVAVADGTTLKLYHNRAAEPHIELVPHEDPEIAAKNPGSGTRHRDSSANPDVHRGEEDKFAAGAADYLNRMVTDGKIDQLFLIADPRTLGELRRHFHPKLREKLVGELHKDLVAHPVEDIVKAIHHA